LLAREQGRGHFHVREQDLPQDVSGLVCLGLAARVDVAGNSELPREELDGLSLREDVQLGALLE